MKKILLSTIGLLSVVGLAACGNTNENLTQVSVGVMSGNNAQWEYLEEELVDDGIDLEIITFTDYQTPNLALVEDDVDLNSFQTKVFLEEFIEASGSAVTSIGDTTLNPIGVFSETLTDIDEIEEGGTISIPNDVAMQGRALILLQTAGLVEINPESGVTPDLEDITSNPRNLEIIPVQSHQTARSIQDVDAAVITNDIAVDAGFIPTQDSIFLEPVNEDSEPYINVIATREEDADNEVYQTIVDAYQTEEVAEIISEMTQGSSIPAWD